MNKWYVSISNKARGPFSDLQMRDKISQGEFKADTLSYKEGEPDWLPLEKQDIWTPGFVPDHPVATKSAKDWVLLVESPLQKGDYQQQGPFSDAEVKEKIKIGEVHLKDFCWKPGMANWKPLFETYELGLPRKEKITFVEDSKPTEEPHHASTFEEPRSFGSQMPDFVEPNDVSVDTSNHIPAETVFKKKPKSRKLLPPIEKAQDLNEILVYLVLVAALFLGSFYIGFKFNRTIIKSVQGVGSGVSSVVRSILPATPSVSYVFLRELPLTKGTLLIKTDAVANTRVFAKVYDDSGRLVRTLANKEELHLKTNNNGEVYMGLEQFKVTPGESYLVTARVGSLKAKKNYTYSFK